MVVGVVVVLIVVVVGDVDVWTFSVIMVVISVDALSATGALSVVSAIVSRPAASLKYVVSSVLAMPPTIQIHIRWYFLPYIMKLVVKAQVL